MPPDTIGGKKQPINSNSTNHSQFLIDVKLIDVRWIAQQCVNEIFCRNPIFEVLLVRFHLDQ